MWWKEIIETLFGLGLFINALLFVPQIIRLYRTKSAEGVSLITFGGFWLLQLLTILHGVLHHDVVLSIGFLFSLITCGAVVVLIIFYRCKNL